ncbi:LysR family transcriptional regulator [Pseudomonas sp. NPDC090203]|uniref:LysR family transcriptional regulator n=1 Tax=Pseudomonas sp. NPDC090203 TaxID=3364477 RepID=UPI0038228B98
MTDVVLKSFDLNLLVVFSTLMKEKSVTQCAAKLNVGQSAVSNSLGRLRVAFDDPLFVRAGRGVVPTRKALILAQRIGPALELIHLALEEPRIAFDPDACRQEFSIAVSGGVCASLILGLIKPIRELAPWIALTVERADSNAVPGRLVLSDASIGIGYFKPDVKGVESLPLVQCRSVLVRAQGTEPVKSIGDLCHRPHALVPFGDGLETEVDKRITKFGMQRRVAVRLSSTDALEDVLKDTDIVAVIPDFEAHRLEGASQIVIDELPIELQSSFDLQMSWSEGRTNSAPDTWFRNKVSELIRAVSPRTFQADGLTLGEDE